MKTVYQIHVTEDEADTIAELMDALDNCPVELTNDGYVAIMGAITERNANVDIEGIEIVFERG